MKASLNWKKNMEFVCDNRGLTTIIDAATEHGGEAKGPSPKELVLDAMMGCTAMDVVSILKKMRQEMTSFHMEVEAEKTTEHPVHFKSALLIFHLQGNLDDEKVKKAVNASLSKYCGVNYMISKTCALRFKIILNETCIQEGPVEFIS